MTPSTLTEALDPAKSITESVNQLLEATDIKGGMKVAILDGTAYGLDGASGVVKGNTAGKNGFVDVQVNHMVVPIPANLLLPVP